MKVKLCSGQAWFCVRAGRGQFSPNLSLAPKCFGYISSMQYTMQERSSAFKIRQNAFPTGALTRTRLGEFTMLPGPLNRMGRGYPLPSPVGAFCVSIFATLAARFRGGGVAPLCPPSIFSSRTAPGSGNLNLRACISCSSPLCQ